MKNKKNISSNPTDSTKQLRNFIDISSWCPLFGEIPEIPENCDYLFFAALCKNIIIEAREFWEIIHTSSDPDHIKLHFSDEEIRLIMAVFYHADPICASLGYLETHIWPDLKNNILILPLEVATKNIIDCEPTPFMVKAPRVLDSLEGLPKTIGDVAEFEPYRVYALLAISEAHGVLNEILIYDEAKLQQEGILKNDFENHILRRTLEAAMRLSKCKSLVIEHKRKAPLEHEEELKEFIRPRMEAYRSLIQGKQTIRKTTEIIEDIIKDLANRSREELLKQQAQFVIDEIRKDEFRNIVKNKYPQNYDEILRRLENYKFGTIQNIIIKKK